jgi:hypothetical protein
MLHSNVQKLHSDVRTELADMQMQHSLVRKRHRNVCKQLSHVRRLLCGGKNLIHQGGKLMAFKRKSSQVVADAQTRAANLKSISPTLDLGSGLTLTAYKAKITAAEAALEAYNIQLAKADAFGNDFKAVEKELSALSTRMLAGTGVKYGKDSNEYEMAGGTRSSEIKRGKKPEEPPA